MESPDILKEIIRYKKTWCAAQKDTHSLSDLRSRVQDCSPTRGFADRISAVIQQGEPAVIAEIKKASPSAGVIRHAFDPVAIAHSYAQYRATCISVLTDVQYFQGSDLYLTQVRDKCPLPLLRKDFIIDEYQIHESRLLGADCILLIVSILTDMQLQHFSGLALELGMDSLIEIHDREQLERASMLRTPLIGINNRDLHTFRTDLQTTLELLPDILPDRIVVTESGIHTQEQVQAMRKKGVHTFLVGTRFMQAADPGCALAELFFKPKKG